MICSLNTFVNHDSKAFGLMSIYLRHLFEMVDCSTPLIFHGILIRLHEERLFGAVQCTHFLYSSHSDSPSLSMIKPPSRRRMERISSTEVEAGTWISEGLDVGAIMNHDEGQLDSVMWCEFCENRLGCTAFIVSTTSAAGVVARSSETSGFFAWWDGFGTMK